MDNERSHICDILQRHLQYISLVIKKTEKAERVEKFYSTLEELLEKFNFSDCEETNIRDIFITNMADTKSNAICSAKHLNQIKHSKQQVTRIWEFQNRTKKQHQPKNEKQRSRQMCLSPRESSTTNRNDFH